MLDVKLDPANDWRGLAWVCPADSGIDDDSPKSSEMDGEDDDDEDPLLPGFPPDPPTKFSSCDVTDPDPAPDNGPKRPALSKAAAAAPKKSVGDTDGSDAGPDADPFPGGLT